MNLRITAEVSVCSEHWYFTRNYNIALFGNISQCYLPEWHDDFKACPPKPLILDGWWYSAMTIQGGTSGEVSLHILTFTWQGGHRANLLADHLGEQCRQSAILVTKLETR